MLNASPPTSTRTSAASPASARRAKDLDAHRSSIRHALTESLAERLPLDEARRAEWRVAFAFATCAVDQPDLTAVRNRTEAAFREQLAQAITNGKECGEVPAGTDAVSAAAGLLALVEGLGPHTYLDPAVPAPDALSELDRALTGVLPASATGTTDQPHWT